MTGREIVDYILDERGIVLTIGSAPCVSFDQQFRQDWGNLIDKKVAEETVALRADNQRMREAALAFQELTVCYRINKRPSEKLFKRLDQARAALDGKE
jgi:hypothetical protein